MLWRRGIVGVVALFFLCKKKTAYEMRISDWSSDVCSSDLDDHLAPVRNRDHAHRLRAHEVACASDEGGTLELCRQEEPRWIVGLGYAVKGQAPGQACESCGDKPDRGAAVGEMIMQELGRAHV